MYYNELIEKQKIFLDNIRNHSFEYFSGLNQSNENAIEDIRSFLLKANLTNYTSLSSLVYKSLTNLDVEFKDVFDMLPHLAGKSQYSIQPKFKQSKFRFGSIVIGIPTIKREKASYLLETLKSVFDAMNEHERNEAVVVIFIPEVNSKIRYIFQLKYFLLFLKLDDQSFVQTTIENINRVFSNELESGLLEIVVPPIEFYPNFNLLPQDRVFNDSKERVKWRTKQNYDFSYMMAYCQKKGIYYLQVF